MDYVSDFMISIYDLLELISERLRVMLIIPWLRCCE
jgi:hypothetical protein